jgi:CDGSH-type Zn-finger protein
MSNRFSRPGSANGSPPPEDRVTITPYRDGPLIVRGPVTFLDQEGNEIEVERKVVALCRCGKSRIKPFCDGTHKTAGFRAASGAQQSRDGQAA